MMLKNMGRFARLFLFLLVVGLLFWRILAVGLADYFTERNDGSYEQALFWGNQPESLRDRALFAPVDSEQEKLDYLQAALQANPADARLYVALARQQPEKEQALLTMANQLAPYNAQVQLEIAQYWLAKNAYEPGLVHLNTALTLRSALHKPLFPYLLALLQQFSRIKVLMAPLIKPESLWQERFFLYLCRHDSKGDVLTWFYRQLKQHGIALTERQQRVYLGRLRKDGQWRQMHQIWLAGLPDERKPEGLLYNGGFEWPLSKEGFGWYAGEPKGIQVRRMVTHGISGMAALRVKFFGLRSRFGSVYQYLMLKPGRYRFQGRVKVDDLQVEHGLQWQIRCVEKRRNLLMSTPLFKGRSHWKPFQENFTVPNSCSVQILRLSLRGRLAVDYQARGAVWFDDLDIQRR